MRVLLDTNILIHREAATVIVAIAEHQIAGTGWTGRAVAKRKA